MSAIEYTSLSDDDKLELLRLLYHDYKEKMSGSQKEKLVREAQLIYTRLKQRSN